MSGKKDFRFNPCRGFILISQTFQQAIFHHLRILYIYYMRICLFLLSILCSISLFAQEQDYTMPKPPRDYDKEPAKNAAFIELAGNAGLFSLNYERLYLYRETFRMGARAGLAPNFNGVYVEQVYLLENNFIFFKNPHHLELGIGATMQRRYNERPGTTDSYFWENIFFSVWRCGYRYQKQDEGFFLRAGLTPVFMSRDALGFHPDYFLMWGGASIGMSF